MKTVKPQKLSVLHRVFEHRGRRVFVPSLLLAFPLQRTEICLHEVVLWKTLLAEIEAGGVLDEMMFKPGGEALLSGSAYAPGGKAVSQLMLRMQVGAVDRRLMLSGNRYFGPMGAGEAEPFVSMPLGLAQAFGGEGAADNPAGKGALEVLVGGKMRRPLPNLEDPKALVHDPAQRPRPAFFNAQPFGYPQRQRLLGSYDSSWLKKRYPGFADDLDLRAFMVAQEEQRIDGYWQGGESFVLENMHPELPGQEGTLPSHRPRLFVTRKDAKEPQLEEIKMHCDTVHFFPSVACGLMVFRGVLPIESDDASEFAHLLAALEAADAPRSVDHYQGALERRLDPEGQAAALLKDSELLPPAPVEHEELAIERFGDMTALLKTDEHLNKNQRRAAEIKLEAMRVACREAGLDPDEHLPKELPPEPEKPSLDRIDVLVEELEQKAREAEAEAEKQRAAMEKKAEQALAEAGVEKPKAGGGGPPTFSAEEQQNLLRQQAELMRIAGGDTAELEATLRDPEVAERLQAAEDAMVQNYQQLAHYFPAATLPEQERKKVLRDEVMRALAAGESLARRDLTGADLSQLDLSGADLSEAFLEGVDLRGTTLRGACLDSAVLARARLEQCDLSQASMVGCNLGAAELLDCTLKGADLREAILVQTKVRKSSFAEVNLNGCDMRELDLTEVSFSGATASKMNFLMLELEGVDFSEAQLQECVFLECRLDGASFAAATLDGSVFVGCTGREVNFAGCKAKNLRFCKDSVFEKSNFRGAKLPGAAFRGTQLRGSQFVEAELPQSDLSDCDLRGANLSRLSAKRSLFVKTDLRDACFLYANLMESVMQKANIRATDFRQANLFRVDFARIEGDKATLFDGALRDYVRFVHQEGGMVG